VANKQERRFEFIGPMPQYERTVTSSSLDLISPENLHTIVRRAWIVGRYHVTGHFKTRGRERGFDVLDTENAIQFGVLRGRPEYCPTFSNWKCRIIGPVEDRKLEIVVALDDFEDYDESPLIIPITGYWRD
jgi:hypothetical protein